jgi:hypothetical protein
MDVAERFHTTCGIRWSNFVFQVELLERYVQIVEL